MTTVLAAPNPAAALLLLVHDPRPRGHQRLLIALNSSGRHIYAGTVPSKTVASRRAANKVARLSQCANRNHR